MTSDARLAFDPFGDRNGEGPPDRIPDRIFVRDHVLAAEIGAFQSERGRAQRLRFDVMVEVRPPRAPAEDDVDRILSYDTITDAIAAALAAGRMSLLETLGERVATRILTDPLALRCLVRIEKLDRGPGALGVEIVRAAGPAPAVPAPGPRPRIVFLSNAAIASERLAGWLDQIAASGPAILCVGPPDAPAPAATDRQAEARIALLAIEQNAWALAARDPRLAVTGTRTELDWAIRHDRLAVWAPARLVLDAADPPAIPPRGAADPAAWLAARMDAQALLVIGAEAPATDLLATDLPVAAVPATADRLP